MKLFKKYMIILLVVGSFSSTQAQISMLDSTNSWSEYSCCYFEGLSCSSGYVSIGEEAIINGKSYRQIQGSGLEWFREDSGYVYHKSSLYGEEIYYDFNLQVGDTFYFPQTSITNSPELLVQSVSTIFIYGKNRKYIDFFDTGFLPGFAFIEGVGSTFGVAYDQVWYYDCNQDLLCFTDSAGTYLSPNQDSCYYVATGIDGEEYNNPLVEVSPNPTQDVVTITGLEIGSTLRMVDVMGKVVYENAIVNTQHQINTNNWAKGLYVIQIKSFNKTTFLKVVKQ